MLYNPLAILLINPILPLLQMKKGIRASNSIKQQPNHPSPVSLLLQLLRIGHRSESNCIKLVSLLSATAKSPPPHKSTPSTIASKENEGKTETHKINSIQSQINTISQLSPHSTIPQHRIRTFRIQRYSGSFEVFYILADTHALADQGEVFLEIVPGRDGCCCGVCAEEIP